MSCIKLLSMGPSTCSTPRLQRRQILTTPRRAEQESETGDKCERHVGPRLDRLVDGIDEIVGHFAHGVDRFAAGVLRAGHDVIDAGAGLLPRRVALIAEDGANLL